MLNAVKKILAALAIVLTAAAHAEPVDSVRDMCKASMYSFAVGAAVAAEHKISLDETLRINREESKTVHAPEYMVRASEDFIRLVYDDARKDNGEFKRMVEACIKWHTSKHGA